MDKKTLLYLRPTEQAKPEDRESRVGEYFSQGPHPQQRCTLSLHDLVSGAILHFSVWGLNSSASLSHYENRKPDIIVIPPPQLDAHSLTEEQAGLGFQKGCIPKVTL